RLPRFTAASAVLAGTVTFLAVYLMARDPVRVDPSADDVVRVGVAEGASIPAYVEVGHAELAGLSGDRELYALVSFTAYLPPDRLAPMLSGVRTSSAFLRVPMKKA